ncbi:MAG: alpha/beta fold hydrolase [Candidatus Thermoplasmatota archaeon]|nr:alpha/beta fold hydrolase [Candidatus Thermoplasmatota archaeon]
MERSRPGSQYPVTVNIIICHSGAMEQDPVINDMEVKDGRYSPSLEHVEIEVDGETMFGVLFKAQGPGPKPTVVLLHGFPGHERNFDIAHSLKRAGFNVLVFHYRGAWGSDGTFSFSNMLEDTKAAVEHLRENCMELLVDPDHIIPIGHSMGGWAAMMTASEDARINAVGSLAGFNLGLVNIFSAEGEPNRDFIENTFKELTRPLHSLSPVELLKEIESKGDEWNLLERTRRLSDLKVLMIGAKNDPLAWPKFHFDALAVDLRSYLSDDLATIMLDSDHNFSSKRITLSKKVVAWCKHSTTEK